MNDDYPYTTCDWDISVYDWDTENDTLSIFYGPTADEGMSVRYLKDARAELDRLIDALVAYRDQLTREAQGSA